MRILERGKQFQTHMRPTNRTRLKFSFLLLLTLASAFYSNGQEPQASPKLKPELELSRPVRPWEFLSATGTRAALFGNEAGNPQAASRAEDQPGRSCR